MAEDLTQETFLQAWRHLHTFAGRASLKTWLHRIAHREFLRGLGRQRPQVWLEAIAEVAAPQAMEQLEEVELREVLRRLPVDERVVLLLHYLEGYTSGEIAQILRASAGTVCYRLSQARERLRRELGEDDLTYLNEQALPMRQWAWVPLEQTRALEARLATSGEAKEDNRNDASFCARPPRVPWGWWYPMRGRRSSMTA
jgi:RNA polymerase sigma-70 factor, ECF subfamily